MANLVNAIPPRLPTAPAQYEPRFHDQYSDVLRLYFNQLANFTSSLANGGPPFNYIDFDKTASFPMQEARIGWNAIDETLDLGMANGVTQQIGQETYARVANQTGSTIPNGSVVGFAGATSEALLVAPYLADGTQSSLYILGVMTHELPDSGQKGYCTTWGFVRGLNTSAFTAGDILYASPSTAGAFTNVKPTAPDNVVPVAACVISDATNGVIFVRPSFEQQQYYGTFSDTTAQTVSAAYTPKAITFNTTDLTNGVSRGTPTSRIVTSQSGFYNFQFSVQLVSSNASAKKLWIWPRTNGVDIPNSNSEITIAGGGTVMVAAWNWTSSMDANDYFEIVWAAEDVAVSLHAVAAQTGANGTATFARPGVPSIILTVTQVQQ